VYGLRANAIATPVHDVELRVLGGQRQSGERIVRAVEREDPVEAGRFVAPGQRRGRRQRRSEQGRVELHGHCLFTRHGAERDT
jgi:hypothetical protein